ncbi:MAG: histidine triad nucleotide-binding protein [Pseudomonadales bacterium]|jgi:diadenosine tetraphosphate (Ap4A) HIT family hydrolase|nr:histidine triad nucleotide-binding protein [Pseudomonadales bacterium]
MDTIFGKIIRREIPADILYEDDQVIAFRDINPQAPVHLLIIPKNEEIPTLDDARPDHQPLLGHMLLTAQKLARDQGIAESGYRLIMNCREQGGQTVYHLHMHLLGGKQMLGF